MRAEYSRVIDDFVERSRLVLLKKPYIDPRTVRSYLPQLETERPEGHRGVTRNN